MVSKANHVSKKQENKGVRSMSSILKPGKNEIGSCITKSEKEYSYCDKLLYFPCVKDVRDNWKLESINEDFMNGYVKTFLINWGMMGRVLGREAFKKWEVKLPSVLKKYFNKLQTFQGKPLENEDIEKWEKDIKAIYQDIREIVGPTSSSKILHLICPDFFPLWDSNIRKQVGVGDKEKGYYEFMKETKGFLDRYANVLGELAVNYDNKSKLRLIDEYLWWVANKKTATL